MGTPLDFAVQQADHLIEAEIRGHPSHGLLRLSNIVGRIERGLIDPTSEGAPVWETAAFCRMDGGYGLGPVLADRMLRLLTERAHTTGVAVGALHSSSHLGMLAPYVDRVARGGQCVIVTCTTEALVHPWGGRTAMVGTNPLAIGVPADPRPLVLDMSTGIVSMGKVLDHARRGQPIPQGWAVDAAGDPTTDAQAASTGALSPFGGAKGYALGIALEVLIASVTRTSFGTDVRGTLDAEFTATKGDLFLVIDPVGGVDRDAVSRYLNDVRATPPQDVARPVTVPGDRTPGLLGMPDDHQVDVAPVTLEDLRGLENRLSHPGVSPASGSRRR